MSFFGTILISVSTLVHIYVLWRISTVPLIRAHVSGRMILLLGLVLWVILVSARYYGHHHTGPLAFILEILGMNWLGILFLLLLHFLAADLLTGFGFLLPRVAGPLRNLAMISGMVLSLFALYQGLRTPVIETYQASIPNLPRELDGKKIIAIADLHLGTLRGASWLRKCVERIRAQSPDLIVLLGDVFEGHDIPGESVMDAFGDLSAPLGVYGVLGNHEFHGEEDVLAALMQDEGIQVLRNRWVTAHPGLVIAGVDDARSYRWRGGKDIDLVGSALKNRPENAAVVFLSHRPGLAGKIAARGVSLMLSGHTHGGQIWPFDYITRRFFPLLEGKYRVDGMTVIVNRGTGGWGPTMRLWQAGEISYITLRKG